jgi:hypothetical protein
VYGPATPTEVHAAMQRLPDDADFSFGETEILVGKVVAWRSLHDLSEHYAPPGEAIGDE